MHERASDGQLSLKWKGRKNKLEGINWKEIGMDMLIDIVAGMVIAIGIYNFALYANFPVAGFSGMAIILYHLLGHSGGRGDHYTECAGGDLLL